MLPKITLPIVLLLFFITLQAQEHFPGGVAGAEAWYMVNHTDYDQQIFKNSSLEYVKITPCNTSMGNKGLFNFNHSLYATQMCLTYSAPLEAGTSRNVFFVGEPKETVTNFSHLTTGWNPGLTALPVPGAVLKNHFDLTTKNLYADTQLVSYTGDTNANINFYNWNIYQTEKKYKSYGYVGETSFYIGKDFTNSQASPVLIGQYYNGNFPEFISFPFELSANQRNRVESYLALKYGITLNTALPYRNAKNTVFWNKTNNVKFGNHIFGIGRDDISGLNQLQSESVHNKNYLVASVKTLAESNPVKQTQVAIENNHFIPFGHNGEPLVLEPENDFGARILKRKWLSQNTGGHADEIPMFFKVNITGVLAQALAQDSTQRLWMLHDRFVTNQQVSDFNNNYVEYYDPANVTSLFGFFEDVFFDTDKAIYDQFTFGVGPQMIVQVRFMPGDCDESGKKAYVVITGGKAPYDVSIENTNGSFTLDTTINELILPFETTAPDTYSVYVIDANGNEGLAEIEVVSSGISVELGPNQTLTSSLQQVTLNAGLTVTDTEATYQWFLNDILLEDQYGPTLVAVGPGVYKVIITSGDRSCQKSDFVVLSYNFAGTAWPGFNCDNPAGTIALNLTGGTPPYITVISNTTPPVNQVHTTESFLFSNVAFGPHTLTTTDVNGSVFTSQVDIPIPFEGLEVDLISQLDVICGDIQYNYYPLTYPVATCPMDDFTLDASILVTYPNAGYEWFMDGLSLGVYDPVLELSPNGDPAAMVHEVKVEIMNLDTGCSITENFGIKGGWSVPISRGVVKPVDGSDTGDGSSGVKGAPKLTAKVYPNPSEPNSTFYYEVTYSEDFEGVVNIYSPLGTLLSQTPISGNSTYTLPFNLLTSGIYLICTQTNGTIITSTIIIN